MAFRVALVLADRLCGGGTVTRVSVTEGIVSVQAQGALARLVPGAIRLFADLARQYPDGPRPNHGSFVTPSTPAAG
jgi:hypothetical protein